MMNTPREVPSDAGTRGPATAAFLAAGIGAFAMGFVTILHEASVFSAPTLYGPAGGVSGRTTLAVLIWLISWAILHVRWRNRPMHGRVPFVATMLLIGLGVLLTFPPVWGIV